VSAPTDLELMMFTDGELDPDRAAEIEAILAGPAAGEARAKVAGLRAVSRAVAEEAWPEAGPDLAGDIMARLEAEPPAPAAAPEAPVKDRPKPAPEREAAPVVPLPRKPDAKPLSAGAANDNGRLIYALALGAAAAAALVFAWGRGGDESPQGPVARIDPTAVAADPDPPASLERTAPIAPSPAPAAPDEAYGVEVAAVDFGARSGAIYYVPAVDGDGAADNAVTTVVWLTDD
jgi:hypothetical protein